MSVVKIKVVSMIGRMSELDDITSTLGKSGVFHPDNSLSFYSNTSSFTPLTEENPYSEALHAMTETMNSIGEKVGVLGVRAVEKVEPSIGGWQDYVKKISESFAGLLNEKKEAERKNREYAAEAGRLKHFTGLDLDLDALRECRFIKIRFGSIPKESVERLNQYEQNPYVVFFTGSSDETRDWGMYCAPIDRIAEVDRIFSGLYFERIRLHELTGTTQSALKKLLELQKQESRQIQNIQLQIQELWGKEKQTFQNVYSWLTEKFVYFGIRKYAARYEGNFVLTGWIPADREPMLRRQLDRFESVKYTFDPAEEPDVLLHSPPVKLKNKRLFGPFEYLVKIYGLPSYDEVDPTPLVALTYVLLFGIMFADLGQGLCILLVGLYMWRKRQMPLGRVLIPCGVTSSLFGILFGSVFGFEHALDPFYKAVFGLSEKPVSVMEPETTNSIIYSAVGIGILLVIVAILMNVYSAGRRKKYTDALFGPNGIAGLVFYSSLVFGFGGQLLFGWQIVGPAYILCLIVLPLLLMFFREILGGLMEGNPHWKPESWGDFIMQNFFEVFEFLLSFLTNTVSFIRVGAFVLVHAGMMMVVFMLGEMMSSVIAYILVIILGNVFVMALEGLLVGIQALRLEFYEMFSRFFEGNGRPFTPVVADEKS